MQCWRLDSFSQSLVIMQKGDDPASIVYWGASLPKKDSDGDRAGFLWDNHLPDFTGGMMDRAYPISICPQSGDAFPGHAGLIAHDRGGGPLHPRFKFKSARASKKGLALEYEDAQNGLTYKARFSSFAKSGIIAASAELTSKRKINLHWLSAPVVPASVFADKMIDFSGRWLGEFEPVEVKWAPGIRRRHNPTGRSGHEHFPALIILEKNSGLNHGNVHGLHYAWSGGHDMIAEELPDGRRQIQFGHAMGSEISPGKRFSTAPLCLNFSDKGENGCAAGFQRHLRDHIVKSPNKEKPRPVHYNCWEAVYFDHKPDELKKIAGLAASLGVERFVLDDGWFCGRNDDTSSLGDWQIDRKKYPDGLKPLIDHVHKNGMEFGLWMEPEMVSPDSELYRKHPDWVLSKADQSLGRSQKLLDMRRAKVRDYLFNAISILLDAHPIDYIKWDHNRVLPFADAAQTRGTYALLDRLRKAFPNLEIESCSSGGGRIDFGILERTQRVWLSDSNDAVERARIQHHAAMFLPSSVTGSHVGPRKCHTSGRQLDIGFRAWVAAQRHMGFEFDPRELTMEERETLRQVTAWWKQNRDWMMQADLLRLEQIDPAIFAEIHVESSQKRFVSFVNRIASSKQISPRPQRLSGLLSEAEYEIRLRQTGEANRLSRRNMKIKSGPMVFSGQYLMEYGMQLPWSFPNSVQIIEGRML